ncbi:hypothetical protein NDU88_002029 [Pleurodeles waltl]|uniref:Uncharacterized protein n=1 Tax=Pleurodeles waltl TaxID=8319 RepID=A0AAV7T116_PLEWA|nr:hypothetical protein NDU88_002029 [Pleurodeles waltl]
MYSIHHAQHKRARDVAAGVVILSQYGVYHGRSAKQMDERYERLAVPLVRAGLQRGSIVLLHGRERQATDRDMSNFTLLDVM